MQEGNSRPASKIPINALITLYIFRHPQQHEMFAAALRFVLANRAGSLKG
jgi:hypothetical protein